MVVGDEGVVVIVSVGIEVGNFVSDMVSVGDGVIEVIGVGVFDGVRVEVRVGLGVELGVSNGA